MTPEEALDYVFGTARATPIHYWDVERLDQAEAVLRRALKPPEVLARGTSCLQVDNPTLGTYWIVSNPPGAKGPGCVVYEEAPRGPKTISDEDHEAALERGLKEHAEIWRAMSNTRPPREKP